MDQNTLKTFTLAAELLNFTAVAERRNTVQSAVSAQISKLERDIGRTLFDRGRGQTMRLTPEGQAYLIYARRILALSEEAVESVRASRSRSIIRLGTTVTLAMSVVSDVLSTFGRDMPDVQIQIQCDRSDVLLDKLDAGDIDVAFMMDQGRRPGRAFVHSQPLVWVCSKHFKLHDDDVVPLAFLTDGRDLRHYALQALDDVSRVGRIKHLSPHPIGVRAFVQAGLALTVMPRSTVVTPLMEAQAVLGLPKLAPIALAGYQTQSRSSARIDGLMQLLEAHSA